VHPARIEEVVGKCQKELDRQILKDGTAAAKSVAVVGLAPELLKLLGALKYRTSFSQNVLAHSVEMAEMADMIGREIGANVRIARTAALLHDIGKAVTHEVEGAHHHIGAEIAERYGIEPAIVHAIKAHHDDVEATTPEALVVRVVDTISASRPGARGNTLENFAQRMTELETIALSFPGIDKAYALSAGRELRVIVRPDKITDYDALKLARTIARKIETTLHYPGIIRVNVIRETRAVEIAK
jgi:ribonuclease Y